MSRKKLLVCHQNQEKFPHFEEKPQKTSRLAPQFLPSHRPDLPAITDSPEGGTNLLFRGANLLVTTLTESQNISSEHILDHLSDF